MEALDPAFALRPDLRKNRPIRGVEAGNRHVAADQPRADLASHLPRINEFVNMARKKHAAPVLLHCSSGNGRSLAAACAYLVEHCDMTLQRALEVCAAATTLSINVRSR